MTDKLAEIKKRIGRKAAKFHRFMNSPIGRDVIRVLEKEFPGGIGKDSHDTYRREGNREVVEYMKQLQRIHEKYEGDLD